MNKSWKIRGKIFVKSNEDYTAHPAMIRILSEVDDEGRCYYESTHIEAGNHEVQSISQSDLFLNYMALKPIGVWAIRRFTRKDYNGNQIEDLLLTFNPYFTDSIDQYSGSLIFDVYEMFAPAEYESSCLITVLSHNEKYFDGNNVLIIQYDKSQKQLDMDVWYVYIDDVFDMDEIIRRIQLNSYMDKIIEKSKPDSQAQYEKSDWSDILFKTKELEEGKLGSYPKFRTIFSQMGDQALSELHIIDMSVPLLDFLIDSSLYEYEKFKETIQQLEESITNQDPETAGFTQASRDSLSRLIYFFHNKVGFRALRRNEYIDLDLVYMKDFELDDLLNNYGQNNTLPDKNKYTLLLRFAENQKLWLSYGLIRKESPNQSYKPALSSKEISIMRKRKPIFV